MKYFLLPLLLFSCTNSLPPRYLEPSDWEKNKCYEAPRGGTLFDEYYKIVAITNENIYYKHSWNDQTKVFESTRFDINVNVSKEIPCGKDGYEYEVLRYKIQRAEDDISYLKDLTDHLRHPMDRKRDK